MLLGWKKIAAWPVLLLLLLVLTCGLSACTSLSQAERDTYQAQRNYGADTNLLEALQKGGLVIFFRHGITPGPDGQKFNPPGESPDHCASQRQLNGEGRDQAKRTGEAFRRLRIPVGPVLSSPFCRCWESAQLSFGRHAIDRQLLVFNEHTTHRLFSQIPPQGQNLVYVGHAQTYAQWPRHRRGDVPMLREGDAVVVNPFRGQVLGRLSEETLASWGK